MNISRRYSISVCFVYGSEEKDSKSEIRLGEHRSKTLEGYEEVIEADKFYMHPGFIHDRPSNISAGDYDFALYHLKRPATFYSRVSPVCLPDEDSTIAEDVGRVCIVTGWGYTSENGKFSDGLHENEVPIVSWEECNKERSYNGYVKERFMCEGYEEGGRDACQGDSGGPLVCQDDAVCRLPLTSCLTSLLTTLCTSITNLQMKSVK